MDYDAFKRMRRLRPLSYKEFLESLEPGQVRPWPLNGSKPESARGAMWGAASRMGITIETTIRDEVLWVARPPEPPAKRKRTPSPK